MRSSGCLAIGHNFSIPECSEPDLPKRTEIHEDWFTTTIENLSSQGENCNWVARIVSKNGPEQRFTQSENLLGSSSDILGFPCYSWNKPNMGDRGNIKI